LIKNYNELNLEIKNIDKKIDSIFESFTKK